MAWIESHQSLSKHRKTIRAAGRLSVDRATLIGHLHILWWWGLDNVGVDGCLGDMDPFEIATAAEWTGDAQLFVDALVDAGFLDWEGDGYYLHDWYDYAGKLIERREQERERSRQRRAARRQMIDGQNHANKETNNDHKSTDGRPMDDRRSTAQQPLAQYSTVPNQDDDDHTRAHAKENDPEWHDLVLSVAGATFDAATAEAINQDCEDIGVDAVKEAMRRSVELATGNRLAYYRKIVNGWRGKVKSLDDIRRLDEAAKPAREPPRRLSALELAAQAKGGRSP